jgi:HEPN domain-containing protein
MESLFMTGNPKPWFDKAYDDLEMARRALSPSSPLPGMACYHAQQCVEKVLKGYLVAQQVEFRWVHDLVYLIQLCVNCHSEFETLLDAADILNAYATQVRYPAEETPDPSLEDAEKAIDSAEQIALFVKSRMIL